MNTTVLCCVVAMILMKVKGHPVDLPEDTAQDRPSVAANVIPSIPQDIYGPQHNHSYDVKCYPKVKLVVDGFVVNVGRDMHLVLRFICIIVKDQDASRTVTEYSFGDVISIDEFDVYDYVSNSTARKRFEVSYDDYSDHNDTYSTLSHSCYRGSPGAHFTLGERTIRPLSVTWVLLYRLVCRNWLEVNAEEQEAEGEVDREKRSILDNDIDDDVGLNPAEQAYSCELRCDTDSEQLFMDGTRVRVTTHLQSALHLLCSALPSRANLSTNYTPPEEQFDLGDYAMDSVNSSGSGFDVVYEDGRTRRDRSIFTFYGRCLPTPEFSLGGHTLAANSILWKLFYGRQCDDTRWTARYGRRRDDSDAPDILTQNGLLAEGVSRKQPSRHHNYDVRCFQRAVSLLVDDVEVRVTDHLNATLIFFCNILNISKYLPDQQGVYRFGQMETEEPFNVEDYDMQFHGGGVLDVLYEDGGKDNRTAVTAFGQTCRPDPPGPEFSLDAGTLRPHSVMWGLFSKVRCDDMADPEDEDGLTNMEPELSNTEDLTVDYIYSVEVGEDPPGPNHYSDNHTYEVRCALGAEQLLVDELPMEVTEHLSSALLFLCFSSGLHVEKASPFRLGYYQTVEFFDPEEYSVNSSSHKRLDVLYDDGINRGNMRVASMMPDCQSSPPQFELNGKKVKPYSMVWILYKVLQCDRRTSRSELPPAWHPTPSGSSLFMDSSGESAQMSTSVPSNTHYYTVGCRWDAERLLVDGMVMKITRHMQKVLQFLCNIIEVYYRPARDSTYRFGYIVTRESFTTLDYALNSTANRRLDVRYSSPRNRSKKSPSSLNTTCRSAPRTDEFSLDGSRLQPHTVVWSLFSKVRCSKPGSPVPRDPAPLSNRCLFCE